MWLALDEWLKDHSTIVAGLLGRPRLHAIRSPQGGIFCAIKPTHSKNTNWA